MGNEQHGLDPIVFDDSEILILGSLPGRKSIETGMYFANRGNRFWSMMARFYGEAKPESKEQMADFLERHRIALWDVYKSAVRKGSSDESMTDSKYNDIVGFRKNHPTIKKILVAGKKAQQGFEEHNKGIKNKIEYFPVPSTSGANAHFDENKWREAIKK